MNNIKIRKVPYIEPSCEKVDLEYSDVICTSTLTNTWENNINMDEIEIPTNTD